SRRRHTRSDRDWSSDVCSSDLSPAMFANRMLYVLEEAQLEKEPDAATQAALKPVDAYDGVLKVLAEHGINVRRGTAQLDTLQIEDRKSTRLNSSHDQISYAVFC